MAVRKSEARWHGTLREGSGVVKLGSGAFEGAYTYASRFEEGPAKKCQGTQCQNAYL